MSMWCVACAHCKIRLRATHISARCFSVCHPPCEPPCLSAPVRYYSGTPLYPFGFGLSYANFTYSGLVISPSVVKSDQESVVVSGTLTHTGGQASDEVVQVYVWCIFGVPRVFVVAVCRQWRCALLALDVSGMVASRRSPWAMRPSRGSSCWASRGEFSLSVWAGAAGGGCEPAGDDMSSLVCPVFVGAAGTMICSVDL